MTMNDYFGYEGKTVVVTGAASGMGQATAALLAELGAEVYALDVKDVSLAVKASISVNLAKKDSIDAALAQLPPHIDRIFNCAGVAGTTYLGRSFAPVEVMLINFVGPRHLIESLIPRMGKGGAIAMISSIGGMGWLQNIPTTMELLMTPGFDEAQAWLEANKDNPKAIAGAENVNRPYRFSKECLIIYAKMRAWKLAEKKIRINTLSPGTTQTPMTSDFDKISGWEAVAASMSPVGVLATPEQQAQPLVFLNSDMASYISGQDLQVDYGFAGAAMTGQVKLGVKKD